jgi:hypothetical protein
VSYCRLGLPVFIQVVRKRPRGSAKTDVDSPRNVPGAQRNLAKTFDWLGFVCGARFRGGHFFGGIIYLAVLDLRPFALNLRSALCVYVSRNQGRHQAGRGRWVVCVPVPAARCALRLKNTMRFS